MSAVPKQIFFINGGFYFLENGVWCPVPLPVLAAIGRTGGRGRTGPQGPPGPVGSNINIYNSDGTLTSVRTLNMDGKELTFTDGGNRSVQFLLRALFDQFDNLVLDWRNYQLLRPNGTLSVDWAQSWLSEGDLVSVAWVDRILYSNEAGVQIQSVSWSSRVLTDSQAFDTLSWELRQLFSSVNGLSADWELRRLYDSISGDSSLDWEAKELHSVWDARDGLKIGTGDTITKVITATDALDFPDTPAQTSSDLSIALVGAADGDSVSLGVGNSAVLPDSSYTAWVSAPDTVTVRFNNYSAANQDPGAGTFRVTIMKF